MESAPPSPRNDDAQLNSMRIISPYTARTGRPDQSGLYQSEQRFPGVTGLGECCDDCGSGLGSVRVRSVPFKRGQTLRTRQSFGPGSLRLSGLGDLGACGAEPPQQIQVGTRVVNCGPQGASDPEQSRACGGSRMGGANVPIMKTNPAWLVWQIQCAAPVEASSPVQWIRANSMRPDTLPRTARAQENKTEYIISGYPGGLLYFVPSPQNAGGGGTNTINAQGMVNAGGIELEIPFLGTGFLFQFDPWNLGWQPGGPLSSYRPGLGSSFARDALSVATWALPIVGAMTGIIGAASAAGSSATAASGGGAAVGAGEAVMPGAQAVSSGATGGIIGATEGAATGGGLTTAQLVSAAKTAGSVVSAGTAVQKLVAASQTKSAESQTLTDQAQAERDAGNLVAAQQLQAQADAAAMQAKSAQGALISIFGQNIPVWVIAAVGGGALLLLMLHKRKRGK
jgi:hypothetical protein